ncbi:phosphotyrosine protein phosphatase [Trinickia violacea]|uniref:Phosphotyrosine protein phosphatase n=1 Tax=Trinickia violacea TaxID=2571746 RepID=A0A4P8IWF5_9BURK|nr:low molecular weight protein tyrosine phosphatase family protein [Trinickia violacea]QCP52831.1 phosphotyrosine protein phosphatase [Trinickia violacea]
MTRALFICSRNRLRSPSAEEVFSSWPGVEADSAGLAPDSIAIVSDEQIAWAEIIFVMERAHKVKLSKKFGSRLKGKRVVCLDIPDKYAFMQPELIVELERKAGRFLRVRRLNGGNR